MPCVPCGMSPSRARGNLVKQTLRRTTCSARLFEQAFRLLIYPSKVHECASWSRRNKSISALALSLLSIDLITLLLVDMLEQRWLAKADYT